MGSFTGNSYDLGELVRCSVIFTDTDGAEQDPEEVFFQVRAPGAATATTYAYGVDGELLKSDTGNYYVDVDADTTGMWNWRWYATGAGQAAVKGQFQVNPSEFD